MKPLRLLRRTIGWASLGIAGGAVVVTVRHMLSTPLPLESALPGEGRIDRRREGDIYYNISGPQGAQPLVLLHDFFPGASNYEFRRVASRLADDYRVFAPDWLGFGMSERPALAYTGEFYAHLLEGFLRDTVGQPAIVIAHGLAGNIAVRAASDRPELFSRLVLVTPHALAGVALEPTLSQSLVRAAQRSMMGLVPYAAASTRPALRWQLTQRAARAGEGAATGDALDHAYASAHQFGGHHALLALYTGELDLPIQHAFALLEPPVLIVGGEQDAHHSRLQLEDLALVNPNAQLLTMPDAGDAVHEDSPEAFLTAVTTWLRSPRERRKVTVSQSEAAARPTTRAPRPPAAATRSPISTVAGGIVTEEDVADTAGIFTKEDVADRGGIVTEEDAALMEAGETEGLLDRTETFEEGSSSAQVIGKPEGEIEETSEPELESRPGLADARDAGNDEEPAVMIIEGEESSGTRAAMDEAAEVGTAESPVNLGAAAGEARATQLTAELIEALEEQAGEDAQRLDEAIRAEAPGSVTDSATTDAEAEREAPASTPPPPAARPERPANASRTGQRSGSAHTPGRVAGSATAASGTRYGRTDKTAHGSQHANGSQGSQKRSNHKGKRGHK